MYRDLFKDLTSASWALFSITSLLLLLKIVLMYSFVFSSVQGTLLRLPRFVPEDLPIAPGFRSWPYNQSLSFVAHPQVLRVHVFLLGMGFVWDGNCRFLYVGVQA